MQGGQRQKKSKLTIGLTICLIFLILIIFYILGEYVIKDEEAQTKNNRNTNRYEEDDDVDEEDVTDDIEAEDDNEDYGEISDSNQDAEPSVDMDAHTFMVYCIGSNLSYWASVDIDEMVMDLGDDVNVVIQAGGSNKWYLEGMPSGEAVRMDVTDGTLYIRENLGKISMVENESLVEFIKYSEKNYPAEKYTLVLWDHGGLTPISFGIDEMFPGGIVDYELHDILAEADVYFESIFMDACLLSTLEMAMAVKDYANYMIACETIEITTGTYYTEVLNYLKEHPDATGDVYGEIIVNNYMNAMRENGHKGAMSVIELNEIQRVYDSYVRYVAKINKEVQDGQIAGYLHARKNSGYIEGSDSVDIVTLAKNYYNAEADALIDAVNDAVYMYYSDISYVNGLGVYSPCESLEDYSAARESLKSLEYDDELIEFYDSVASILCAVKGEEFVSTYTGKWYDEDYAERILKDVSYADQQFDLRYEEGILYFDLPEDIFESVFYGYVSLVIDAGNNYGLFLGSEYNGKFDSEGKVEISLPEKWMTANGKLVSYIVTSKYIDPVTNEWIAFGSISAEVNGVPCMLMVQQDNMIPDGKIVGYMLCDDATYSSSPDYTIRSITQGDVINIVNRYFDYKTKETISIREFEIDDVFNIKLEYLPLLYDNFTGNIWWKVEDIYGRDIMSYEYTIESLWKNIGGN